MTIPFRLANPCSRGFQGFRFIELRPFRRTTVIDKIFNPTSKILKFTLLWYEGVFETGAATEGHGLNLSRLNIKMSMITAIQWVPRGFAAPFPTKYELTEAEFDRIAELAKLQLDDANEDLEDAKEAAKNGESSKSPPRKTESMEKDEYALLPVFAAM